MADPRVPAGRRDAKSPRGEEAGGQNARDGESDAFASVPTHVGGEGLRPRAADGVVAFEMLHREHHEARELCGHLAARGALDRESLRTRLTEALEHHMAVEEATLYPALGAYEMMDSFVGRMRVGHGLIREALQAVNGLPLDDPGFRDAVEYLGRVLDEHVTQEEGEGFGYARENLRDDELEALAVEMEDRRQAERGAFGVG